MLGRLTPPAAFPIVLLLGAALAGCVGGADPAVVSPAADSPSNPALDAGALPEPAAAGDPATDGDSAPAGPTDPSHDGARALAVHGTYTDYPTGAGASFCTNPPECHLYMSFGINFTGTLTGEAVGVAHDSPSDPAAPDRLNFEKNPVTFTGSIGGCGSGSLGFVIKGYLQPTARGLLTNETLRYVPGSATTGLAGVIDAHISFDDDPYAWPGTVALTGTVWCR